MTFLIGVAYFFCGFITWIGFEFAARGLLRFRKPIINIYQWEWKDIEKFPIPESPEHEWILVTDGKETDTTFIGSITYNSEGKRIWTYSKKIITHWSYFPSAPIKEKS